MVRSFVAQVVAYPLAVVALVSTSVSLSGCPASAAPDAGFLDQPQLMHKDDNLPYDAVWFKEGVDFTKFKTVYVAPVDTTHLLDQDWWDKSNFAPGDQESQAKELAEYFREQVKNEFIDDDENRYTVVDTAQSDSLIVELAIVEVVPTKIWLNAIGYVLLGALDQGLTAFEGRFRDGETNEVIAEFKDREYGQIDVVSLADFEWCRHSRHTTEIWSDQMEEVMYIRPGQTVSRMSPVTLRPW